MRFKGFKGVSLCYVMLQCLYKGVRCNIEDKLNISKEWTDEIENGHDVIHNDQEDDKVYNQKEEKYYYTSTNLYAFTSTRPAYGGQLFSHMIRCALLEYYKENTQVIRCSCAFIAKTDTNKSIKYYITNRMCIGKYLRSIEIDGRQDINGTIITTVRATVMIQVNRKTEENNTSEIQSVKDSKSNNHNKASEPTEEKPKLVKKSNNQIAKPISFTAKRQFKRIKSALHLDEKYSDYSSDDNTWKSNDLDDSELEEGLSFSIKPKNTGLISSNGKISHISTDYLPEYFKLSMGYTDSMKYSEMHDLKKYLLNKKLPLTEERNSRIQAHSFINAKLLDCSSDYCSRLVAYSSPPLKLNMSSEHISTLLLAFLSDEYLLETCLSALGQDAATSNYTIYSITHEINLMDLSQFDYTQVFFYSVTVDNIKDNKVYCSGKIIQNNRVFAYTNQLGLLMNTPPKQLK
ncbi:hypothetical protein NEOKW01_1439 [Nematocida sp. AWRm80]|nr:hypothetical protein NEOKW01_1439 [Nematocida sp. AWRm80]